MNREAQDTSMTGEAAAGRVLHRPRVRRPHSTAGMRRTSLLLGLLSFAAGAQTLVRQAAPLPHVTLRAPGYALRAEVRPAVVYPESGPYVGPYFQFSPAQVRVVLDRLGQHWTPAYPADRPPASVTVTPVQNWLTLYRSASLRADVARQLNRLRAINAGRLRLNEMQAKWPGLPYLPLINAFQAVSGAARQVNTPRLQGVRYLAVYAQESSVSYPRSAVFYTFQGLTRDGEQVVSVQVPYAPSSFPREGGGRLMSGDEWRRYLTQARAQLDAEDAKLVALDRLVQSVRIR